MGEINRIDRLDIISLANNGLIPTKMNAKPFCENRDHAGNSMLSDFMVLTRPLSERNYIRKTYSTYVYVCNFVLRTSDRKLQLLKNIFTEQKL